MDIPEFAEEVKLELGTRLGLLVTAGRLTVEESLTVLEGVDAVLPEPVLFAVGSRVHYRGNIALSGIVLERREHEGEVHSLLIGHEGTGSSAWVSPREVIQP